MKDYIMVKKNYDKKPEEVQSVIRYLEYCNNAKLPFIKIVEDKVYSRVHMDIVGLPCELREYLKDKLSDNWHICSSLIALGIVKKNSCGGKLGDTLYEVDIKTEYAEKFAKYLFKVYKDAISKYYIDLSSTPWDRSKTSVVQSVSDKEIVIMFYATEDKNVNYTYTYDIEECRVVKCVDSKGNELNISKNEYSDWASILDIVEHDARLVLNPDEVLFCW